MKSGWIMLTERKRSMIKVNLAKVLFIERDGSSGTIIHFDRKSIEVEEVYDVVSSLIDEGGPFRLVNSNVSLRAACGYQVDSK